MTAFVRVTDARTGAQYSVTAARAKRDPQLTVIKEPAVDYNGQVLPPTYPTKTGESETDKTVVEEPAKTATKTIRAKADAAADTTKE